MSIPTTLGSLPKSSLHILRTDSKNQFLNKSEQGLECVPKFHFFSISGARDSKFQTYIKYLSSMLHSVHCGGATLWFLRLSNPCDEKECLVRTMIL
jgi:hypothetical protein